MRRTVKTTAMGTTTIAPGNWGVEGATEDLAVLALRMRHKRNLLASLMLSQGVPMILGGDELSRTQQGNNNAYCQTTSCRGWIGRLTIGARDFSSSWRA